MRYCAVNSRLTTNDRPKVALSNEEGLIFNRLSVNSVPSVAYV